MKRNLLSLIAFCMLALIVNAQITDEWDHLTHSWDFENDDASDLKGIADGTVPSEQEANVTFANGDVTFAAGEDRSNSNGGYITLPADLIVINQYDAFSVECWITPTPDANTGGHTMLVYLGGQSGTDGRWYFFFTPSKLESYTIRAAMNAYDSWKEDGVELAGGGLEEERMYHCVTTVDTDSLKLYVDNETIGTVALKEDNLIESLMNDFAYIGRGAYESDWTWAGTLHKLSIYDIALSEAEIEWLYNHEDKDKHQPDNPSAIYKLGITEANVYFLNDGLYIKNILESQINAVKVYNITGSLQYQTSDFKNGIKMNLNTGIYIVKVESNVKSFIQKVIIK